MAAYIITYDLKAGGPGDGALTARLQNYRKFFQLRGNSWIIISEQTPVEIAQHLKPAITPVDQLFVSTLAPGYWASLGYGPAAADWLQQNVS